MKKILVTGADGFIGSHLVEALVKRGYEVRAFVLYNSFNSWGWLDSLSPDILKSIEVFPGDIRDSHCVTKATTGCHIAMHLAALISIPYSYTAPDAFVDTNVKGTLNLLQAATQLGLEKVIQTSTSEVYGTAEFVPITELHPLRAQSPYAATKIAADQLALSFFRSFQTPVTVLRPFNTYGPRQSARAVIPTIITQIAAGQKKISLGSVHTTRDFNFVTDTAEAFIKTIEAPSISGETINIGSNFEVSIADVVQEVSLIMQADIEIETEQKRVRPDMSEVERLWADNAKAKALLGWEPAFGGLAGFKLGLQETVKWFSDKENLKLYKPLLYNI